MKSLLAILLGVMLLAAGCVQPTETPQPQPTYTPVPLSRTDEDTAYLAVLEDVVSVIEGVVVMKDRAGLFEPPDERLAERYSDWSVKVVGYLIDPLPYKYVTLRLSEGFVSPEGTPMPHRWPYHLSPGEHAIFFLTKKAYGPPLGEDQFGLVEGMMVLGKVPIQEGKVHVRRDNHDSVEPAEEFIARLRQYAREAGRTVPPPPETLRPGVIRGSGPAARPEDYLYDADTVVIGRVTEGLPEQQTVLQSRLPPFQPHEGIVFYRDWVVEVESYVVKPLPYDEVMVRIWEATFEDNTRAPVKGPHLAEGEHVLLLLTKEHGYWGYWKPPAFPDNGFTLPGYLSSAQVYIIEEGKVRHRIFSEAPWQPLDEFIARIEAAEPQIQKAIEIAANDPSVKEEISSQGYELGEVQPVPSEPGVFFVAIYVGKRDLPGITLRVRVNVVEEDVLSISRHLRPRELTEEEKAEARRIALSDPEVLETIGDRPYEVTSIRQSGLTVGYDLFVCAAVDLEIPPDWRVAGWTGTVFVDLEADKVLQIRTTPRKSLPPDILESLGEDNP